VRASPLAIPRRDLTAGSSVTIQSLLPLGRYLRHRAFRFYVTFRVKCITFEAVSEGSQNEHHAFIKSLRFSKASPRR
jgi:hypothetical protein